MKWFPFANRKYFFDCRSFSLLCSEIFANQFCFTDFDPKWFFEVAINTWPEWDLNFQPTTTELHSDALTDWAIRPWVNTYSEPTLHSYSNFIVCSVLDFILVIAFFSRDIYFIEVFLSLSYKCIYKLHTSSENSEAKICEKFCTTHQVGVWWCTMIIWEYHSTMRCTNYN